MDNLSRNAYALTQQEDTLSKITQWISEGGTLTQFAASHGANHAQLYLWIQEVKSRRDQYDAAVKLRDEYLRQSMIEELRSIATFDVRDAYDDNGDPISLSDVPLRLRKSIASVKKVSNGEMTSTEIKFFDKIKAIQLLGKELGMFQNKVELTASKSLEKLIEDSWQEN